MSWYQLYTTGVVEGPQAAIESAPVKPTGRFSQAPEEGEEMWVETVKESGITLREGFQWRPATEKEIRDMLRGKIEARKAS
jgi:hypothetical protein